LEAPGAKAKGSVADGFQEQSAFKSEIFEREDERKRQRLWWNGEQIWK